LPKACQFPKREISVSINWKSVLETLHNQSDLSSDQTHWALAEILEGKASTAEMKDFLLTLRKKGESAPEIFAMVEQMYRYSAPITITDRAVDTVGTGGDGADTINISTTAAIVTAAAGARVVKHGNRAATSKAGSADVLEALGLAINLDGLSVAECVRRIGIGFCFAPKYHPAMRFAAAVRREIALPTVFNILGPLANPANPKAIAIGVANEEMMPIMAKVLAAKGCEGFVFRGDDGLDEISVSTTSTVIQIFDGKLSYEKFDPRNIGIEYSPVADLVGGDPQFNADVTRRILKGEQGAPRDAVALNAAAAIAAFKGDFSLSVEQQLANGWVKANAAIDSGAANNLLAVWSNLTQELARSESERMAQSN
jgi:anthranilate phosphoribosyltransferase